MTIVTLGIDLGKTVCSIAGMDAKGHIVVRKRLRRDRVIAFAANLPRCVIAMEACCGAHHIGRRLAEAGHDVRLMPPEYVKPYVKAQKNDALDAEAIAEAATRPLPGMKPAARHAENPAHQTDGVLGHVGGDEGELHAHVWEYREFRVRAMTMRVEGDLAWHDANRLLSPMRCSTSFWPEATRKRRSTRTGCSTG